MNKQHNTDRNEQSTTQPRARRWLTATVTAVVVGTLSIAGVSHANEGHGGWHRHGKGMHGNMTPEQAAKRVDHMIERMVPDATADQKSRLSTIMKSAFNDLRPLREQHRAARGEAMKLLSQQSIDRAALERVRVNQMQAADRVSKRMTQALADASEVLTPQQRVTVAERMQKRMERMR